MNHLIEAVRRSVQEKNWYAALTGALALPDIAGKLDGLSGGSEARYVAWFDRYLTPTYTTIVGGSQHVFLCGNDCYALRCAFLHLGDFDLMGQTARRVLTRFEFVEPPARRLHLNHSDNLVPGVSSLQVQISFFCEEICMGVEKWLAARATDPTVSAALAKLPVINFNP